MYETPRFYRSAAILFASLTIATLLAGYLSFNQTLLINRLLPAPKSFLPWAPLATSDGEKKGQSTIAIHDAVQSLDYEFVLSDKVPYSYASVAMLFNWEKADQFADFSKYQRLTFNVKCIPANTLSFTAYTFDAKFSDVNNPETYRIPTAFFSCNENWQVIEIDLQHMGIPEWWLSLHKINLADQRYQL